METKSHIIAAAEQVFDYHGFTATGMDRLTRATKVSSRTLYKHVGSKTALIVAVLEERGNRFFAQFDVHRIEDLFARLESWTRDEGARGCLFFRALRDTGGAIPEIAAAVAAYHQRLHALIMRVVAADIGHSDDTALGEQILVLFEGATTAASYRGVAAVTAARKAAALLVDQARQRQ